METTEQELTWNAIADWQHGGKDANGWTRVPAGWTGVVATVDGLLNWVGRPKPRNFLVPAHEYTDMMVIGEGRHLPWPAVANETGQPDIVYTSTPIYNLELRHHVVKLRELLPPGRDDHAAELGEVWRFDADEKLGKPVRWRAFRYGRGVEETSFPSMADALASVGFRLAPYAPIYQPVPDPGNSSDYAKLVRDGRIIDMAGRPLEIGTCSVCGKPDTILNITCVRAVPCPGCPAKVGGPCQRPSEHRIDDGFAHRKRQLAAQAVDDERAAAGDLTVPALWRPRTPAPAAEPAEQLEVLIEAPLGWEEMFA